MKAPFEGFNVEQIGLDYRVRISMNSSLILCDYGNARKFIEDAIQKAIDRANSSSTANLASSPPPPEGSK